MPYNPFDKDISELKEDDLQLLLTRKVAEGYYVEFKSQFPAHEKIAHSIAAFANTYGGWFIVGVQTDGHNVATSIPGFPLEACHDPIAFVRDIIRSHIDPIPTFFSRAVTLKNGNTVFILEIPEGQETPFITKNGRVYRRVSDSKEPIAETNRHALDELVARGSKFIKYFEHLCHDSRPVNPPEPEWLNLYFAPYPPNRVHLEKMFTDNFIKKQIEASHENSADRKSGESMRVPFESGQYTHDSVIFRSNTRFRLPFKELSAQIFQNGAVKMFIPFSALPIADFAKNLNGKVWKDPNSLTHILHFVSNAGPDVTSRVRVFDLSDLLLSAGALLNNYLQILGKDHSRGEFRFAFELANVERCVPFVDDVAWWHFASECGMPILQQNHVRSFIEGGFRMEVTSNRIIRWQMLAIMISLACGLPTKVNSKAMVRGAEQRSGTGT